MKIIIGLGNPGLEYSATRHNLGANVVLEMASQFDLKLSHTTMHAYWGRGSLQQEPFILAQPQTFMNCSGRSVAALSRYYKVPPQQILIIVDDLNLPLGVLRFRGHGSAGGHNGLKSIIEETGTKEFHRLRIGIEQPPPYMAVSDYVLGRFSKEEKKTIEESVHRAAKAAACWLAEGLEKASREFN